MRDRRLLTATMLGVLFAATEAHAYTKEGHFEITNAAYQVMRAASLSNVSNEERLALKIPGACATGNGLCESVVSQAQWDEFIKDLDWTRRYLGAQPHAIPTSLGEQSECVTTLETGDVGTFTVTSKGGVEGDRSLAPDHRHLNANKCSADRWKPVGVYAGLQGRVPADGRGQQGKVLGWHAKNRDDDLQETMIDINPLIPGPLLAVGNDIYEKGVGALLLPIICVFEWLNGDASSCDDDARRVADKTNVVEVFTALIPGIHLDRGELYIGFWHLMNVRDDSTLTNTFDDHQGMYLPEAGPERVPGAMDNAIRIGSELLYLRIVPEKSEGTHRYAITSGEDDDEPSMERAPLDWRREPFGTTEFSSLDNLALSGYVRLAKDKPITRLGWPLHAIGDATIPMHVVATTSWGHSSYEKWIEMNWQNLTYDTSCEAGDRACEVARQTNQLNQAARVLQLAYRWREYLGHSPFNDRTGNAPGVRDFITDLGRDTLARVGDDYNSWPWCDMCSIAYDVDLGKFGGRIVQDIANKFPEVFIAEGRDMHLEARDPLGYYDQHEGKIRELVESAMGAKLAFLNWHVHKQLNQCIEPGHYGCVSSADCCEAMICQPSNVCGPLLE